VVLFPGMLPFALVQLGLELLSSSLYLSRYFMRVALLFGPLASCLAASTASHWSSSQTVPLTLVLRLLASAELRLYQTSLPPHLIISRTIWSEWTQLRWSPWAWQNIPWAHSRNL
jgi:hypothetical protein